MIGKIKVEDGVYRVTVAEAVYITPDMTLKDLIDSGYMMGGSNSTIIEDENGNSVVVTMKDLLQMVKDLTAQVEELKAQLNREELNPELESLQAQLDRLNSKDE